MNVALSVGSLAAHTGGPSRTVPALGEALGTGGVSTLLLACAGQGQARVPNGQLVRTRLIDCGRRAEHSLFSRAFRRQLRDELSEHRAELLHDNGVWLATNHAAISV